MPSVGASLLAKNVNDNAALSGGPCRLYVFREQARSYSGSGPFSAGKKKRHTDQVHRKNAV